VLVTLWIRH